MFKWLLKKQYYCMGFALAKPLNMLMGKSDEHNDSNIFEWFMNQVAIWEKPTSIDEMEYVDILSCWVIFNHFEFGTREVFRYGAIGDGEEE